MKIPALRQRAGAPRVPSRALPPAVVLGARGLLRAGDQARGVQARSDGSPVWPPGFHWGPRAQGAERRRAVRASSSTCPSRAAVSLVTMSPCRSLSDLVFRIMGTAPWARTRISCTSLCTRSRRAASSSSSRTRARRRRASVVALAAAHGDLRPAHGHVGQEGEGAGGRRRRWRTCRRLEGDAALRSVAGRRRARGGMSTRRRRHAATLGDQFQGRRRARARTMRRTLNDRSYADHHAQGVEISDVIITRVHPADDDRATRWREDGGDPRRTPRRR